MRKTLPLSRALKSTMLVAAFALAVTATGFAQQYTRTDLTADASTTSATAANLDSNLVNAWGLSRSSGSPWWVSDNGTGFSTLYDGTGSIKGLVVTIPPADPKSGLTGTPTGTVFNGTMDF